MAYFWQISGPGSHFERKWTQGDPNRNIANAIFKNLVRTERPESGLTLFVGVQDTGASQILIPECMSCLCDHLPKWKHRPFASSEFASVSPIYVETSEGLFNLLNERQNSAKTTKAKKERRDVSKANGKFCDGPRNLTRANFERGRTFWRLLTHAPEEAGIYGLPHPWWATSISILSFAFSFWRPDGSGKVSADHLLVASVTELDIQSQEQRQSWCYRIEEQTGLQNADELDSSINVATETIPQKEAVKRLQDRLYAAVARGPVVLLLHDFSAAEKEYLSLLGFDVLKWVDGLGLLLGYNDAKVSPSKKEEYAPTNSRHIKSRSRSRSPTRTYLASTTSEKNYENSFKFKPEVEDAKDEKPKPNPLNVSLDSESDNRSKFYVVSIVELYKAVTGKYWERITPNVIFDMMTRHMRSSEEKSIARNIELDSTHIMQAWLAMVKGPFIEVQKAFLDQYKPASSTREVPENTIEHVTGSGAGHEIQGLHSVLVTAQRPFKDPFNDDSGSDWDD